MRCHVSSFARAEVLQRFGVAEGFDIAQLCARTFGTFRGEFASFSDPLRSRTAGMCLEDFVRRTRTVDHHPRVDDGTPSAALRPPASGSHPPHWRHHHRHGSRRSAPTREEADGTPSPRCRVPPKLDIHVDSRTPARRTRQNQNPARRGSRTSVCATADTPAVLALVPESVPCLEAAAARVYARRSLVLSAHVAPSPHSS